MLNELLRCEIAQSLVRADGTVDGFAHHELLLQRVHGPLQGKLAPIVDLQRLHREGHPRLEAGQKLFGRTAGRAVVRFEHILAGEHVAGLVQTGVRP